MSAPGGAGLTAGDMLMQVSIYRKKRRQSSLTVRATGVANVRLAHGEQRDGNIAKALIELAELILSGPVEQSLRGYLRNAGKPEDWKVSMYTNRKASHRSFRYMEGKWAEVPNTSPGVNCYAF